MNYGIRAPLTIEELKNLAVDSSWQRIEQDLSDEELEKVEEQYTKCCLEIDQLEVEKKSAVGHFSSLIKKVDTEREQLRMQILTKKRSEDMNVFFIPDHEREVMCLYSVKSGKKVKERPLEHWERQQSALEDFANEETETETETETADATAAA